MSGAPAVAVLGAGAIGLLYAGGLGAAADRAGGRVLLVTRRPGMVAALREGITVVRADGSRATTRDVDVLDDTAAAASLAGRCDVVLVTVAAYDSAAIAPLAARLLAPQGVCITLQNGLDNCRRLAGSIAADRVIQGSTGFPVHLASATTVHVNGPGTTALPALPEHCAVFVEWLRHAGLEPRGTDDPERLAWIKAAMGTIGYLCIVFAVPVGRLRHCAAARPLCERAQREVIAVARAAGVLLDEPALVARQRRMWDTLDADARSSLWSSFAAGRPLELDDRLGDLIARGARLGVATPVLTALYDLCRARQEIAAAEAVAAGEPRA